jgi:hypothetical protein
MSDVVHVVDASVGQKNAIFTFEGCPVAKRALCALPDVVAVVGVHSLDNHRTRRGIPIGVESEEWIGFPG